MTDIHVDVKGIISSLKKRKCRTVGLQFPDGLRKKAIEVAEAIQSKGFEVILSGEPCHGACDIASMPCDVVVHIGHAPLGRKGEDKVVFEEVRIDGDIDVLQKAVLLLKSPVALVTTAQHAHQLTSTREFLEKKGLTVLVGEGGSRIKYPGQVLGCDFSSPRSVSRDAKSILYFGSGAFHPLGVALSTGLDVLAADPLTGRVMSMEKEKDRFLRQRFAAIELASRAQSFGILVSKKAGQSRLALAQELKGLLREQGRKGFVIYLDNIVPENLEGYGFEAFVCTACPRIAIDDYMRFKKPVVNPKELEIALGQRSWKNYELESF